MGLSAFNRYRRLMAEKRRAEEAAKEGKAAEKEAPNETPRRRKKGGVSDAGE